MTFVLQDSDQLLLATAAGRAPSPHNIQPARWRFGAAGRVELHEATARWLAVGDPSGRDNALALGAAWEGMALAASQRGLGLGAPRQEPLRWPAPAGLAHRLVAAATLATGASPDPLAAGVEARRSWRGSFAPAEGAHRASLDHLAADHALRVIATPAEIATVAGWYDEAAAAGMRNPLFARELYAWMRFSAADPRWPRDGLSTDCMALSSLEAMAARFALRPAVVRALAALGLEKLLVSEAAKVRSAQAVVLLHGPLEESWFDAGRRFYRFWLDLAARGLCGVPMSALSDSPPHAAQLLQAAPLPAGRRLVAILRVGPLPAGEIPRSARLPAGELLLP